MEPGAGFLPVIDSVVSPAALLAEVESAYEIGGLIECALFNRGLNDTYLVRGEGSRFFLRLYRAGWRTAADIQYELDLLVHLGGNGLPVSMPVARRDGSLRCDIPAPEGARTLVLFTAAPGVGPSLDETQCRRYGETAAAIHIAADQFVPCSTRFSLDLAHLINEPLAYLLPFLAQRPADHEYLVMLAAWLRDRLERAAPGLEWGACHGDLHAANANVAEDGTVTVFDFDCCGPGWRAYDLASFRHAGVFIAPEQADARWQAFLGGYTSVRGVSPADLASVSLFVAAREIWLMGLHAGFTRTGGSSWMSDRYFDRRLALLRDWDLRELHGEATG